MSIEFAVGDVETTGFSCYGKDRIIEISIVRMDKNYEIISEYTTLINPCRDVGPVHVHGITASDVINAPLFEQVAGDIMELLDGAVYVAHNASFDVRFFQSEMRRIGYELPSIPQICTLALAREFDTHLPSRRLTDLCAFHNIQLTRPHAAEADVHAVVDLLIHYLNKYRDIDGFLQEKNLTDQYLSQTTLPKLGKSGISVRRKDPCSAQAKELPFLAKLVSSLHAGPAVSEGMDDYLCLLDRAIEDRCLTEEEEGQLARMAVEFGLTGGQVKMAHCRYMRDLLSLALQDEVITEREEKDLHQVRCLLGLSIDQYQDIFESVKGGQCADGLSVNPQAHTCSELVSKTVCFTGSSIFKINGALIDRNMAEQIAANKGMIVHKGVTKKLDILVVTDPNSLSTKAKKARSYGTRIIAEEVFWRMLSVNVD